MSRTWAGTQTILRSLILGFGLLQAYACRFVIKPGGVNYLDAARSYLRGDWNNAINAYWSPLYSWLLSFVFVLFRPSPRMESTALHFLNFAIYAGALFSFEYFLRGALAPFPETDAPIVEPKGMLNRDLWFLGYALFLFSSMFLVSLSLDTPDLCVTAFVYLAVGLVVRIRLGEVGWGAYALLGIVLGLAYLAKAVMFPLAFAFLACAWFAGGQHGHVRFLFSVLFFAIVAGPLIAVLSIQQGHLTFGESAALNYANYVNGVPDPVHWQGQVPGAGTPLHAVRQIRTIPPVYEYSQPIRATYPPSYDPTYWLAGVRPHLEWKGQVHALRTSLAEYFLMFSAQRELLVGLLAFVFFVGKWRETSAAVMRQWTIWFPAAASYALYAPVHVETRFFGSFFVVLWLGLFLGLRPACSGIPARFTSGVLLAMVSILAFTTVKGAVSDVSAVLRRPVHEQWEVAQRLQQLGVRPGDKVAVIGHTNRADYWAHLMSVSIAAEVPQEGVAIFWASPSQTKTQVMEEFAYYGAKTVVTFEAPPAAAMEGWEYIVQTHYYAHQLHPADTVR
jgi:hypothetical protein